MHDSAGRSGSDRSAGDGASPHPGLWITMVEGPDGNWVGFVDDRS